MKMNENVLIASLDERWGKYRMQLKLCKNEFSEEAVHDLRVATRRLLAVMDMLRALDPHPRIQKMRRALKDQLDSLDDLRDTQVMLVEVSESAANMLELKPFGEYLLAREKKLLRTTRKEIKKFQASELKRRVEKSRASLEKNAQGETWTARLLSVVDQAYGRAVQAFGQIEASQPASIHRLRVAFKKFRYMVEIANPILENYPEAYLKQMHDYQSRMGNVQDARVFISTLTEYAEQSDSWAMFESVRNFLESHQAELITTFMNGREEMYRFWRGAPDQKFPWEMKNEPVHRSSRNRSGGGNARIRRRQPASADRQGEKEDAENRARLEENGGGDQPDPDQPIPAGSGNSQDSEEGIRPE